MSYYEELCLKLNQELKVDILISNIKSEKVAHAAMMVLGDYHMAKDKHMLMASYDECLQLVESGVMERNKYFPVLCF